MVGWDVLQLVRFSPKMKRRGIFLIPPSPSLELPDALPFFIFCAAPGPGCD
jgi:hypothetical protein